MDGVIILGYGERVRKIREILGLGQKSFSKKVGISYGYVSEIEQEKKNPGSKILVSLSQVGVNPNWVLSGEGYPFRGIGARLRTARENRGWRPSEFASVMRAKVDFVLKNEAETPPPAEDWVESAAIVAAADLRWLKSGWDRDDNYTPNIFCAAEGSPPVMPLPLEALEEPSPYYPEGVNPPNITGLVQDALRLVALESNKRGLELDDFDRLTVIPGVAQDFAFSVPEAKIRTRVNEILDAIEVRRGKQKRNISPDQDEKRPEG